MVVVWINLAHDIDQWWALMNGLLNVQVPQNGGDFLII
jgi:hypothetical protein